MKKIILIACLLAYQPILFAAQNNEPGRFGAGIVLGEPSGISGKYWLNKDNAINGAIGFGDVSIHADYLWHNWKLFAQPKKGYLTAYYGPGLKLQDKDKDTIFGIRAAAGASYEFEKHSVEIFMDLTPVLELSPDMDLDIDIGIGIRYWFK
ncbi:MAG: hypothetical protein HY746_04850 [Elusimicrobia bacterium]|nr:hypothetical protein [Elusimicrobiota bacterium]